jgi:CarD family transcriptional regulator
MYKVGDLIIYSSTGVCEVTEIMESVQFGSDEKQACYILKPLYQNCIITTPVDSTKVFMRPVISKDEAERIIDSIPSIQTEAFMNNDLRQLEAHYKASFVSHCCEDLMELSMSIYMKKQLYMQQNRRFGAVDEKYMKRAEELLFGELSAVLGIAKDTVPDYIAARVGRVKEE